MNPEIEFRELQTLEDFQACVEIQKAVWGFDDPYDIVPLPLLVVGLRMEGVLLGAFEGERMIGFVYSLPGFHKGRKMQWSHMLAVLPEYRNLDIGYRLKMEQYKMSLEKGYEAVEWTFDPLESRNAYFNLNKLGCIAMEYEVNIYGITSSPLHHGMPTDRLVANWPIPELQKVSLEWTRLPEDSAIITKTRPWKTDLLLIEDVNLKAETEFLFVEIPQDIQKLRTASAEEALNWRWKTRQLFLHYFSREYVAYSFLHWKKSKSFYVLKKN